MYIIISQEILKRTDLSGEEKILLAYVQLLTKHNKTFFGSEAWCIRNFGFADLEGKKRKLISRGFCSETQKGEMFFITLPEYSGSPKQAVAKPHKVDNLAYTIKRWEAEGWELLNEGETVIQMTKDEKIMNIPKHKFEG